MVKFNELRVSNNDTLIIDASVFTSNGYNNVYIDSVIIHTQDTYSDTSNIEENYVYKETINGSSKNIRIELNNSEEFDVNNLFFVYIKTKGNPSIEVPCNMDNRITLGVTMNTCSFFTDYMNHVKETLHDCTIPKNFIDDYLRFKALELSVNTKHFIEAIDIYNRFFKNLKVKNYSSNCRCNG